MTNLHEKYKFVNKQDYENVAGSNWPSWEKFVTHQHIPNFVYTRIDQALSPPKIFDHPSFCVLPFYGWEYPINSACCLLRTPYNLDTVRSQMLQGLRPQACSKCWTLEDMGIVSDRQVKNSVFDYYLDRNIQDIFDDCQKGNHTVNHYKIDTNNTCNATCVTCNSQSSSAWRNLLVQNGKPASHTWQVDIENLDQQIDYDTARFILFRGGEPMLSKTNFDILQRLIDAGNTDCFVSFQTNGSITPTPAQEALLSKLTKLNISFSIDGIQKVFEYVRYPLKWSDVQKNIAWCRERNIDVSAFMTISNINVYYYQQTVDWFKNNNINFSHNLVHDPEWFSPNALPTHVKSQIAFDFQNTEKDQRNFNMFKHKIAEQDKWKNIDMKDYLPELCALLG